MLSSSGTCSGFPSYFLFADFDQGGGQALTGTCVSAAEPMPPLVLNLESSDCLVPGKAHLESFVFFYYLVSMSADSSFVTA